MKILCNKYVNVDKWANYLKTHNFPILTQNEIDNLSSSKFAKKFNSLLKTISFKQQEKKQNTKTNPGLDGFTVNSTRNFKKVQYQTTQFFNILEVIIKQYIKKDTISWITEIYLRNARLVKQKHIWSSQ